MNKTTFIKTCFLTGFLCVVIAFLMAPDHPKLWVLGLLTGIPLAWIIGYFTYDLARVRAAIPIAWERAKQQGNKLPAAVLNFFRKSHPFIYPTAFMFAISASIPIYISWLLATSLYTRGIIGTPAMGMTIVTIITLLLTEVCVSMIFLLTLISLAIKGVGLEGRFFVNEFTSRKYAKEWIQLQKEQGLMEAPFTYINVLRWTGKGLLFCLVFVLKLVFWESFCWIGRTLHNMAKWVRVFVPTLIHLIHSQDRVLAPTYGTLGGTVAFLWFGSAFTAFPTQLFIAFLGGVFGIAAGLAGRELVAKTWLKLSPNGS